MRKPSSKVCSHVAPPLHCADMEVLQMTDEKIKLRTETGQLIEVVVLNKRADFIEVVIGEGVHNVRCTLTPTRNGLAYAGSVMGREVVRAQPGPGAGGH